MKTSCWLNPLKIIAVMVFLWTLLPITAYGLTDNTAKSCLNLRDETLKNKCLFKFAKVTQNVNYCLQAGDSACIDYLARITKNPDLCQYKESLSASRTAVQSCRQHVSFDYFKNPTKTWLSIIILPIIILLIGIYILLKNYSKSVKIRYLIIASLYLFYYITWILQILYHQNKWGTEYMSVSFFLFTTTLALWLEELKDINIINQYGFNLIYSALEFFMLAFFVILLPKLLKSKYKILKSVIITLAVLDIMSNVYLLLNVYGGINFAAFLLP